MKQQKIDAAFFKKVKKLGVLETHEYLASSPAVFAEQKELFLAGKVNSPRLDYPRIKPEELAERRKCLLEFPQAYRESPAGELYWQWRKEKIAEVDLLLAVAENNHRLVVEESTAAYGWPNYQVFFFDLYWLKQQATQERWSKKWQELLKIAPKTCPIELPSLETIERVREETKTEFAPLLKLVPEEEVFEAQQIEEIFLEALEEIEAEGWEVAVEGDRSVLTADQEKKKIIIPAARKMARLEVQQRLLHEIGTHVLRRINGEKSCFGLLGVGFPKYLPGEEGVAILREQILEEGTELTFSRLDRHLAIGLALLGYGVSHYDFKEVFELMQEFYRVAEGMEEKAAQEAAWQVCWRTYRGTTCETKGACYTKDIVYHEGNLALWAALEKGECESATFNVGKFDPANWLHRRALEEFEIK
jgi:hypothetical protein